MQNRRRVIPRRSDDPHRPTWRNFEAGNHYANYNQLHTFVRSPTPGTSEENLHPIFLNQRRADVSHSASPNQRRSVFNTPNQHYDHGRQHRAASCSSDQSYQPGYGQNHRQRGAANFRNTNKAPSGHQGGRRPQMGFKALAALLEKDAEELILDLSNSKRGFPDYIKTSLTDDGVVLFTKVLRKVCDASFLESKHKVLQMYFDDPFTALLISYIGKLPLQDESQKWKNKYFWNDTDDFWNNVIKICEEILDSMPTFALKVLPMVLKSLNVYIPSFESEHKQHISDGIKRNVKMLLDTVQTLSKENEEKEKEKAKKKMRNEVEEEPPPNDFREISVYPDSVELISKCPVYLRQNVIKGPYKDVDHYLDVQFRLLREDFVGPLRSGIEAYRSKTKKNVENVKVYNKVQFLRPETKNELYCIRIQFDVSKKKKFFRYENSRRFMFGTLLCFTRDNFKTFIFGKVSDRKVEDLEKGELIVGFDENPPVQYQTDYVMVECRVFFEPYFHVLTVLKHMAVDNFPMEKYIIDVDPSVEPPEYLTPERSYVIHGRQFFPLVQWPQTRFYDLNDSQLAAFRAALTQEFAVIQGPPGTGKTFLGLKVAKTLLENKDAWYKKTPMLVICFTNHALDQFLEGILPYTTKVMRVGGQSKNESLQSYNLRNKSRFQMNSAVYEQRYVVQRILTDIKNITENLKLIDYYNSIRAFSVFECVVPNFTNTWFYRANKDQMLDWFFGGIEDDLMQQSRNVYGAELAEGLGNIRIHDDENKSNESDDEDSIPDQDDDLELNDDDIFDEINSVSVECSIPLITLSFISNTMNELANILTTLANKWKTEPATFEEIIQEEKSRHEYEKLRSQYDYLNMWLTREKANMMPHEAPANVDLQNPAKMAVGDRWKLYFHWLNLYKNKLNERLNVLNRQFRDEYRIYEEMRDIENSNLMKEALVVGMTTTGAARLRSTLQTLKSPIVIVEEAAEVLEAHIVSSITKHCKHLILIGDHQQLRPSTANFNVETHYKLGISLFERMVLNDIHCYSLNVQHRMRPEIADLIRPTIYPNLEDHPTVLDRKAIAGVDNNLFFIDHTNPEVDCEGTSKKNHHEVQFLIAFARHLILNGYAAENITILAAYLGQMFELQRESKKHKEILENVRIAVLDNYQGEECDIILLSLVRNNAENKIGFLKIENRVCVALSRARNGLYVMGNMTQLCSESQLWQKIRKTFEEYNALGPDLPLRCQIHTETVKHVKNGFDFLEIPEGGCSVKCEADLVCGHKCTSFCHIRDREHENYKCRIKCGKRLCDENEKHICEKMCYEDCGPCCYRVSRKLQCGHEVLLPCHVDPEKHDCVVPVPTRLPCGHTADKPCHCDPLVYRCPHPCEAKVEPCGHACLMRCHVRKDPDHLQYKCRKPCAKYRKNCSVKTEQHMCRKYCYEECDKCTIIVRKGRTVCPHFYDVPCCSDVDQITCEKPCTKKLSCGHKCKNKCYQSCGPCEVKVDKVAECGHSVKVKCNEEPDKKLCKRKCPFELPCGHPCTQRCDEPCTSDCKVVIQCNVIASCGHTVTRLMCFLANKHDLSQSVLLKYCNAPCTERLKCGHECSGSCGECSQGRVHKRCAEKCGVPLVCDHLCEFPCREACRPCQKNCQYRCQHSACRKKCGEVCTPCKERCPRSCPHRRCTRFCGQVCNVPPCEEPCPKVASCGHACVGFCGDPCPPKCAACDEELTEIFFGFEDEEDARFVLLRDCGHVFESRGLEQFLGQNENEVSLKTCPRCKTPIKTTLRYNDDVKRAMEDVAKVKAKLNGTAEENQAERNKLLVKLRTLEQSSLRLTLHCPKLAQVLQTIDKRLELARGGRRQPIDKYVLNALTSKLQIVEHITKIYRKDTVNALDSKEIYFPQIKFLSKILLREKDHITNQEIDDIDLELNRLSRMVEYSQIKKSVNFRVRVQFNASFKRKADEVERWIFDTGRFDEANAKQCLQDLSTLSKSGIGISESEKRDIVKAMGFSKGHWYKCPNGHPYVITECGGAMQESNCNECGAKIGGSSHRLLPSNAVATEMDGATHGAWTEAANLANYNLRDLM